MDNSFIGALFFDEPPGTFSEGYVFTAPPDLSAVEQESDIGHWSCDLADHDRLTWSDKVYELFGLPVGTPIDRDSAMSHYSDGSRDVLERVRNYALRCKFGFMLDAAIEPEEGGIRSIRVLAVPILDGNRVVRLEGLKRAL